MTKHALKIAKQTNEMVAHNLNEFFYNVGILAIAKDYGEQLKWPFEYFIEEFNNYSDDDKKFLEDTKRYTFIDFIKRKYSDFKFVAMFDSEKGDIVKCMLKIEDKDKGISISLMMGEKDAERTKRRVKN